MNLKKKTLLTFLMTYIISTSIFFLILCFDKSDFRFLTGMVYILQLHNFLFLFIVLPSYQKPALDLYLVFILASMAMNTSLALSQGAIQTMLSLILKEVNMINTVYFILIIMLKKVIVALDYRFKCLIVKLKNKRHH